MNITPTFSFLNPVPFPLKPYVVLQTHILSLTSFHFQSSMSEQAILEEAKTKLHGEGTRYGQTLRLLDRINQVGRFGENTSHCLASFKKKFM